MKDREEKIRPRQRRGRRFILRVLCALLIVLVITAVAGALYFKMTGRHLPLQSVEHTAQRLDPNAFPPAGTIVFTGPDGSNPSLNPTKAELTDVSFTTVSVTWQIRELDTNHIVGSGPGETVTDVLTKLDDQGSDKSYLIDFFAANQNYKIYGDSASFSVQK